MSSVTKSAQKVAHLIPYTRTTAIIIKQTKQIGRYSRNGEIDNALNLFYQMQRKNQVSWNAMLTALLNCGCLDRAASLFEEMPQKNSTSYTSMITGLSRVGRVKKARQIFESMPLVHQNVYSWTSMISCYVLNDEPVEAVRLFLTLYGEFYEVGVLPNSHTLSVLMKACGLMQSIMLTRQLHSLVFKLLDESEDSIYAHNTLIDVYAKLGKLVDAERVFDRIKRKDLGTWNVIMDSYRHHLMLDKALGVFHALEEKDILSWNIIISGLLENCRGEEALIFFLRLIKLEANGTKPNSSTYSTVLTACATLSMLEFGKQLHAHAMKICLCLTNIFVSNSLIAMYASCGSITEMEEAFNEMPKKDVISWNSLVHGLGRNGFARKALDIAEKALDSNIYNKNTFISILTSCSHGGLVDEGLQYFSLMKSVYGVDRSVEHYVCVIDMLGRAGRVEEAYTILINMPFEENFAAWSTLFNACLIHRNYDLGKVAANKLLVLRSSYPQGSPLLQNMPSLDDKGENSRMLLDFVKKMDLKEPGCSWVLEREMLNIVTPN